MAFGGSGPVTGPLEDPELALEEAKSFHVHGKSEVQQELEREGLATPERGETQGRWSRRRRLAVVLIVIALLVAVTGLVAFASLL